MNTSITLAKSGALEDIFERLDDKVWRRVRRRLGHWLTALGLEQGNVRPPQGKWLSGGFDPSLGDLHSERQHVSTFLYTHDLGGAVVIPEQSATAPVPTRPPSVLPIHRQRQSRRP